MAVIEVNHQKIEKGADHVDSYISKHKAKMKKIDAKVTDLQKSWDGKDYTKAKKAWKDMNTNDSTSGKMLKDLKNYSELLRFSARKYKKAQIDAINRSKGILL